MIGNTGAVLTNEATASAPAELGHLGCKFNSAIQLRRSPRRRSQPKSRRRRFEPDTGAVATYLIGAVEQPAAAGGGGSGDL